MKRFRNLALKTLKLLQRARIGRGELRRPPGSSKHRPANRYRGDYAHKIREQACWNRVPGLFHTDRSKVNGSDIKRGLRASVNRRCRKADNIIRAKSMHDFRQYC